MPHLTQDQIERWAEAGPGFEPDAAWVAHVRACGGCREEIAALRALIGRLADLPSDAPSRGFADEVMRRVELPAPWLERALARLPRLAPSPGFATAVLARVRLPIPWPRRAWRFARRRQTALAGASAAAVGMVGAGAAWLFAVQGIAPSQVAGFALGAARELALQALLALGRFAYQSGIVDPGGSLAYRVSPTTAIGGLALLSLLGLMSMWVMSRLWRPPPGAVAAESP